MPRLAISMPGERYFCNSEIQESETAKSLEILVMCNDEESGTS